uniref:Potassium channel blocker pMeKTx8-1 n=1 Tax=Mesobuthus eupeus TaxID=34648 RepID=A0A088D9S3_MESEU|nr:potassium channel blocker pMeKTx8-1 [Mesobuthus eupeus]
MNNYYKIVLIMVAFFAVTITFSNIHVEGIICNLRRCQLSCRSLGLLGKCIGDKCECVKHGK